MQVAKSCFPGFITVVIDGDGILLFVTGIRVRCANPAYGVPTPATTVLPVVKDVVGITLQPEAGSPVVEAIGASPQSSTQ
jgi:hypothetical protein